MYVPFCFLFLLFCVNFLQPAIRDLSTGALHAGFWPVPFTQCTKAAGDVTCVAASFRLVPSDPVYTQLLWCPYALWAADAGSRHHHATYGHSHQLDDIGTPHPACPPAITTLS